MPPELKTKFEPSADGDWLEVSGEGACDEVMVARDEAGEIVKRIAMYGPLVEACSEAFEHATNDPIARLAQPQLRKLKAVLARCKEETDATT